MRTLFVKIFLSVLLTVLLTFAVGFAIAVWVMPRPDEALWEDRTGRGNREFDDFMTSWKARTTSLIETYAESAADAMERHGVDAAMKQIDALNEWRDIEAELLDDQREPVRAGKISSALRQLAVGVSDDAPIQRRTLDDGLAFVKPIRASDGQLFVLVAKASDAVPRLSGYPGRPPLFWIILLRTVPVAITLGLVCFMLARYITKPVVTMRSALRRFGEGELEQRVGSSVGKRRDEIGELARDFDHMAERIATLLAAQRRLLEDISHELRSPLARQRVALELARQHCGDQATGSLDRVEREAERLDELVGQLLTLTRLESDQCEDARTPLELAELVREVVDNAAFEAQGCSRSIRLMRCDACDVNAVPELLRRAVENIVRNALAYTGEGTAVEVALEATPTQALIRVRDKGPGVPDSDLAQIFHPFYRVGHARDRQTGGVGLGLAIAERAVRSHGGQVVAKNQPEGGLSVEVRLPRDLA